MAGREVRHHFPGGSFEEPAMKAGIAIALLALSTMVSAEEYGAPITLRNPVSLEAATRALGDAGTARVLVQSKVDKVCEVRGCWIGLKSDSGDIHVTFKDESFFVPLSLKGKTVIAQGLLSRVPMTLEQTRQRVKAEGGDPAAVKRPGVRYEMVASGIVVKS
jgi:hypothetical protein